ncbi:MAG: hypothetical protein JRI77_12915 [Deltaproteobacteria bacterium]|nr:hypothetical protein [Deltaproteobacteria bacterium]
METIHLKTVDPFSHDLLRAAEQKGFDLNWERYENLQPQDGFLRLGLSCPYGCMQGPCRIDPFGRGPKRGLCGLDRDGMVGAFFLRLILQGVLEVFKEKEPSFKQNIQSLSEKAIEKTGGSQVSVSDIHRSATMLVRPAQSPADMVRQSIRLGILACHLMYRENESTQYIPCKAGYGLLSGKQPIIGVAGAPDRESINALYETLCQKETEPARLLSLGEWIELKNQFLPCVCTTGEAELLLSSGKISLLLSGPKTDPGLFEICRRLNIPVVDAGSSFEIDNILRSARDYHSTHSQIEAEPDPSMIGEGQVALSANLLQQAFKSGKDARVAIVGGFDTPQLSLGWIPAELTKALRGMDHLVAAWGDAALWVIKEGLSAPEHPYRGPLHAVSALAAIGRIDTLSGICFTGLSGCHELAVALGLAAMGNRVCIATPLPLWGSETIRNLLSDNLKDCGGLLMHYDHPAEAEEILDWFAQT